MLTSLCATALLCLAFFVCVALWRGPRQPAAPPTDRETIRRLLELLTASRELQAEHADIAAALRTLDVRPLPLSKGPAYFDPQTNTVHLVVRAHNDLPYDQATLAHVLLHEACHSMLHASEGSRHSADGHGAEFQGKLRACLDALLRGRSVSWEVMLPCPTYPV